MRWSALRFRLSTLLIIVTVVGVLLGFSVKPTNILGSGITEMMHFWATYGRPFTWFTRDWTARFDSTAGVPPDADWNVHPIGLLANVASGVVAVVVLRRVWTSMYARFHL